MDARSGDVTGILKVICLFSLSCVTGHLEGSLQSRKHSGIFIKYLN